MKPPLLLLFVFSLLTASTVRGATNTAATASSSDVQAAIDLCANGDTVIIPSGEAVWTTGVTCTGKGINIFGAGQGLTVIRDQINNSLASAISINATNQFIRISGLTIHGGTNDNAAIQIGSINSSNIFRVDHVSITNLIKAGIAVNGWSESLIDHCYLESEGKQGAPNGISPTGYGNGNISEYGGATNSCPSWDTIPFFLGKTNMIVIEDNVFDWKPAGFGANGGIDSYNGARWCFRHNIVTNANIGAHGTDSGLTARSTHTYEVYQNTIYLTVSSADLFPFSFRGGTGILWSNAVITTAGKGYNLIRIDNYRCSGTNIYGVPPCCNPYGPVAYTNIYGGKEDAIGYPAYDSIGMTSPTIYGATNTLQTHQPAYQWSNTFNGTLGVPFFLATVFTNTAPYDYIPPANLIVEANRDYYDNVILTNYTPLVYPHPLAGPSTSSYQTQIGVAQLGTVRF